MTELDRLIPTPRLLEVDHVDVAAPPERVWEIVRHLDLASLPIARALFSLRTLVERLRRGDSRPISLRIDDLRSSPEQPGFAVFADVPPREVAIAAIGKVWQAEIPFVHTSTCEEFAAFVGPGFAKVAWAIRVSARGDGDARVVAPRSPTASPSGPGQPRFGPGWSRWVAGAPASTASISWTTAIGGAHGRFTPSCSASPSAT